MTTPAATSVPVEVQDVNLTAADRCDRCGAQAYLKAELEAGLELLFCAHHAREHGDKIREVAVKIIDNTAALA